MSNKKPSSFIVGFWAYIFGFLGKLSFFNVLRRIFKKLSRNYRFVEYYVVSNTILSIIALFVATYRRDCGDNLLLDFAMFYGVYRTFEIFVYQVNILLFDEYRANLINKEFIVKGYRRTVVLLLHNYLEIICWFGVVYMWFYRSGHFELVGENLEPTFLRVFHESMTLMFSFSPDKYTALTDTGITIFSIQAIIGLFMTLIVFARFISLLPAPKSLDEFDNRD